MRFRSVLAAAAAAGVSGFTLFSQQVAAQTLQVLSAFDKNFIFTETMLEPVMEKVKEKTDGRIGFNFNGPEVVPTFEQFDSVQSGVFDIIFCHPGYHTGEVAMGVTIDAIEPDPVKRRESGIWDYMDKHYQEHGMKLIAMPPQGEKALIFIMRDELDVESEEPFAGKKLRANVTYDGLVKSLGGATVLMSGGEIYSALQTGLIDGAAWSVVGPVSFKWPEVANHWVEPSYGQTSEFLAMNLDTWNSLSAEDQEAIAEAGYELELETMELFNQLNQKERDDMQAAGMSPTYLSDDIAQNVDLLLAEGVWKLGEDKGGQAVTDFRRFAEEKGMTPTIQ